MRGFCQFATFAFVMLALLVNDADAARRRKKGGCPGGQCAPAKSAPAKKADFTAPMPAVIAAIDQLKYERADTRPTVYLSTKNAEGQQDQPPPMIHHATAQQFEDSQGQAWQRATTGRYQPGGHYFGNYTLDSSRESGIMSYED